MTTEGNDAFISELSGELGVDGDSKQSESEDTEDPVIGSFLVRLGGPDASGERVGGDSEQSTSHASEHSGAYSDYGTSGSGEQKGSVRRSTFGGDDDSVEDGVGGVTGASGGPGREGGVGVSGAIRGKRFGRRGNVAAIVASWEARRVDLDQGGSEDRQKQIGLHGSADEYGYEGAACGAATARADGGIGPAGIDEEDDHVVHDLGIDQNGSDHDSGSDSEDTGMGDVNMGSTSGSGMSSMNSTRDGRGGMRSGMSGVECMGVEGSGMGSMGGSGMANMGGNASASDADAVDGLGGMRSLGCMGGVRMGGMDGERTGDMGNASEHWVGAGGMSSSPIFAENRCALHLQLLGKFSRIMHQVIDAMRFEASCMYGDGMDEEYISDIGSFAEAYARCIAIGGTDDMSTLADALVAGESEYKAYHFVTNYCTSPTSLLDYASR